MRSQRYWKTCKSSYSLDFVKIKLLSEPTISAKIALDILECIKSLELELVKRIMR